MSRVIPLYLTEAQVAREVLGPGRLDEWKGLVVVLEREGFPPVDPQFGGRYWPACEHWFRVRNRLVTMPPGQFGPQDGEETCPAPKKRRDSFGANAATVHRLPTGPRDQR